MTVGEIRFSFSFFLIAACEIERHAAEWKIADVKGIEAIRRCICTTPRVGPNEEEDRRRQRDVRRGAIETNIRERERKREKVTEFIDSTSLASFSASHSRLVCQCAYQVTQAGASSGDECHIMPIAVRYVSSDSHRLLYNMY